MKTDNELIEDFNVSQGGKPNLKADIDFYESSWDMLMPVVSRIHKMDKMVCINFFTDSNTVVSKIYSWGLGDDVHEREFESESAIKSVYEAVVNFIKWHNEQKFQEEIKGVF